MPNSVRCNPSSLIGNLVIELQRMQKKLLHSLPLVGSVLGAFLIGGGLYASPYLTLHQMYQAVDHQDLQGIASHVDFPALRISVKTNLQALAQKESAQQNPFMRLIGTLLGGIVLDPVIDQVVSPAGISALLEGQRLELGEGGQSAQSAQSAQLTQKAAPVDVQAQYESFNQFAVQIRPKGDSTLPVTLLLSREGLDWKLSGVRLPGT